MRSDLKSVDGVSEIVTDLDDKTCVFKIDSSIDVDAMLKKLAESNNKIRDWSRVK